MTGPHLCEAEAWPGYGPKPAGRRPTPYVLSLLAAVYDCGVSDLLDYADYEHMSPADPHVAAAMSHYAQTTAPFAPRGHAEILRFFDGLDLIEPGLVRAPCWHPDDPADAENAEQVAVYGGVGRVR